MQSRRVPEVLARINATLYNAEKLLPNLSLNVSPVDILTRYERSASSLTTYLYAFSLPLLLMALIFISLVVGMVVARQRNEVAVLRWRGASTLQVVGMALVEGALMGLLGLLLAFPVSQVVVLFFSKAISFLNFSGSAVPLPDFNENILLAGLVVVAVTILAQVLPSN